MKRIVMLLVTAWSVLAVPALCTAGVIAHLCERDEGTFCEHESGCETDPCSERVYRRDGAVPDPVVPAGFETPAWSPVSPDPLLFFLGAHRLRHAPSGPARPPCVRHPSDLPLLI